MYRISVIGTGYVGLVAGTDDDANNLSIVMTARELNDKLFVIARQNREENQELFASVGAGMNINSLVYRCP